MFTIEMLHANEGDALWVEYGPDGGPVHRVLLDCGRTTAYKAVSKRLQDAQDDGQPLDFDLIVLTHVDEDHIFGSIKLLGDARLDPERVADVWFNGWGHICGEKVPPTDSLGAKQGEFFSALLQDRRFAWNAEFCHRAIVVPADGPLPTAILRGGMKLTLLSPTWPRLEALRTRWVADLSQTSEDEEDYIEPGDWKKALKVLSDTKRLQPDALGSKWLDDWDAANFDDYAASTFVEDDSEPNGSSIALLAEYDEKAVVLTGDAFPSVLEASLKRLRAERKMPGPLQLEAFKLPHHGSKRNLSPSLADQLKCKRWLVSTNGSKHNHPDPEAIARVIDGASRPEIYFNFKSDESRVWNDPNLVDSRGYKAHYGTNGNLRIVL